MFSATITGKTFISGLLTLVITFTDDHDESLTFSESIYSTNPTDAWLQDYLSKRLKELQVASAFSQGVDAHEIPGASTPPPPINLDADHPEPPPLTFA